MRKGGAPAYQGSFRSCIGPRVAGFHSHRTLKKIQEYKGDNSTRVRRGPEHPRVRKANGVILSQFYRD